MNLVIEVIVGILLLKLEAAPRAASATSGSSAAGKTGATATTRPSYVSATRIIMGRTACCRRVRLDPLGGARLEVAVRATTWQCSNMGECERNSGLCDCREGFGARPARSYSAP